MIAIGRSGFWSRSIRASAIQGRACLDVPRGDGCDWCDARPELQTRDENEVLIHRLADLLPEIERYEGEECILRIRDAIAHEWRWRRRWTSVRMRHHHTSLTTLGDTRQHSAARQQRCTGVAVTPCMRVWRLCADPCGGLLDAEASLPQIHVEAARRSEIGVRGAVDAAERE
jgi:hypothetical protein